MAQFSTEDLSNEHISPSKNNKSENLCQSQLVTNNFTETLAINFDSKETASLNDVKLLDDRNLTLSETNPVHEGLNFNRQSFDDCIAQEIVSCKPESDAYYSELEYEKNSAVIYDSESCTSNSDSIFETNIENLSIDSISSQESKQQDISPKSSKPVQNIYSNEFIKSLEAHNFNLEKEILELRKAAQEQEMTFKRVEAKIRKEFMSNIEKLSKECNVLRKEKETMVIRYANSEKEVIMEKKVTQDLDKKIKDICKDRDNLFLKLKNLNLENNRLTSLNETKMVEIAKLQKNLEKLNSDFNAREVRIKWLQNNLKTEINSHQETQAKLEQTLQRLNEMKEEAEQVRRDCQEMIKCYQEDEEIKSIKLDSQLKQKLSELELQKQEKTDQEQVYYLLRQELESLKKKQRMTMEENNSLTQKIHYLEKQRLEYEQNLSKLKDTQNTLKQEIVDLTARSAEMETLQLQLEREREKLAASSREIERLRSTNTELQADMNACHVKEGELLKFTEGVTDTNVKLQSAYSLLEVKAQALEEELSETKLQLEAIQDKYKYSLSEIEKLQMEREEESQMLAWKLAEKVKLVEKLNMQLDEAENENRVLKRRHIASIKELSRELCDCKRRLEGYEITNCVKAETCSLDSRASSAASLDIISPSENKVLSTLQISPSKCTNGKSVNEKLDSDMPGIDKEMLIEKIIKLQKQLVSKNERIDFLKDHIVHLVKEMKRKCKCEEMKTQYKI